VRARVAVMYLKAIVLDLLNGEKSGRCEEALWINDLCFEFELARFGLEKREVIISFPRCLFLTFVAFASTHAALSLN
jgi:hypothetical protein